MRIVVISALVLASVSAGRATALELNSLSAGDVRAMAYSSGPTLEPSRSNYPGNYGDQRVRVLSRGPAVIASVSSGILPERLVLGYKNSGILAGAERLSAVLRITFRTEDGGLKISERVIGIGKEWHGNGFLTPALSRQDYLTPEAQAGSRGMVRIELAFTDGRQWDSNYGANYALDSVELDGSSMQTVIPVGTPSVAQGSWDFIVEHMKD